DGPSHTSTGAPHDRGRRQTLRRNHAHPSHRAPGPHRHRGPYRGDRRDRPGDRRGGLAPAERQGAAVVGRPAGAGRAGAGTHRGGRPAGGRSTGRARRPGGPARPARAPRPAPRLRRAHRRRVRGRQGQAARLSGEESAMATFTVWRFDSPEGADTASRILHDAASEHAVRIIDTAVVSWPEGAAKPTTRHGHQDEWRGTGWGAFWGLLLGSLFFAPVLGAAAGAAIGASSKAMAAVGIDKDQLDRIREGVTPGTSALF